MNYCLIHSDNTSLLELKELKDHDIYFEIPRDTGVDEYISELIEQEILQEEPNALFIKYALDKEYLSFLGLRLAHHIRLHRNSGTLWNLPIIFVGEESIGELIKIADLYEILSTPGVYYVNEDLDKVQNLLKRMESGELKGLNDFDDYINKVRIPSPANYDTRHSLVNELAIYYWSNFVGLKPKSRIVEGHIKSSLYFKYKTLKEELDKTNHSQVKLPEFSRKTKILLVDDEAGKGWRDFYEYLFSNCSGVSFNSLSIAPKESQKDVLDRAVSEIKDIDPDVILLDLRLVDQDVYEQRPENLSGYKLIEAIKSICRGIQILITTASNKTETYREVLEKGADDFIIKKFDSPEVLKSLINKIEKCSEESSFLKSFYKQLFEVEELLQDDLFEKITTHHQINDDINYDYLYDDIFHYLEMASQIVGNRNVEERFSYTILYLYNILETLSSYYIEHNRRAGIEEFKDEREIKRFDHRKSYLAGEYSGGHLSDAQKIYNVYYYHKYSAEPNLFENIFRLFDYRNNYVHHTDPAEMDQLEDLFVEDFIQFKQNFYQYYSTVFSFVRMLAN